MDPVQSGKRSEKVLSSPPATLKRIALTREDEEDLRNLPYFAITSDNVQAYDIQYVGTERVNTSECFVLEVKPKNAAGKARFLQGKIWVENQSFNVVKTILKAVPDIRTRNGENLFPSYETNRELIAGHWFPTDSTANDDLKFANVTIHVRVSVKYSNYSDR
jgi:hypothetical protein